MASPLENYTPAKHLAALKCGGRKQDIVGFDLEQRVSGFRYAQMKEAMDAAAAKAVAAAELPTARAILDAILASGWVLSVFQSSPHIRRVELRHDERKILVGFSLNDLRPMRQFIRELRKLHVAGEFDGMGA